MMTWRTVFKNGARKFSRCAIGARKIPARFIPEYMYVPTHWVFLQCAVACLQISPINVNLESLESVGISVLLLVAHTCIH